MKPDATTSRYLRLKQIIGDQKSSPELEPLLPISASSWWAGVAEGRFPKPARKTWTQYHSVAMGGHPEPA